MPSKKKKYNARFPPARIKKIMQLDEEVGKVSKAVPVIISRSLELFVESLLRKAEAVTNSRNAKTLTPSHLKQCIIGEQRFDFLKDLVSTIPDAQGDEEGTNEGYSGPSSSSGSRLAGRFSFPTPSETVTSSASSSLNNIPGTSLSFPQQNQQQLNIGPSQSSTSSSSSVIISHPNMAHHASSTHRIVYNNIPINLSASGMEGFNNQELIQNQSINKGDSRPPQHQSVIVENQSVITNNPGGAGLPNFSFYGK